MADDASTPSSGLDHTRLAARQQDPERLAAAYRAIASLVLPSDGWPPDKGHATLYVDTGVYDVLATLSAGRYLAGDKGATAQLAKTFRNGVTMGAFATKTNVSAQQFGEGSFDKGVFLTIPFDALFTRSTPGAAYVLWKPLTRDGGQQLARQEQLYNITSARGSRTLWYRSAEKSDQFSIAP